MTRRLPICAIGRARGWIALLVFIGGAASGGCRPPEWLKPHLAADTASLAGSHAALSLLDSADVRYIAGDRVRRVERGAIRVASVHGRERATCRYVFNPDTEKILSARAWIVAPDGRRSDDFGAAKFLDMPAVVDRQFWTRDRVLSFSAAERIAVGGVLAWEFQVESQAGISDVNWSFASNIPVVLGILEVTPLVGGTIDWHATHLRLLAPEAGSSPGALRWEVRGLAPPAGERPAGFLPEPLLVSARGRHPQSLPRIRAWADIARIAAEVIEPSTAAAPAIATRAETLVAGKSTRWERIRALTEFVQRDIAYLALALGRDYLSGYRPQPAADVLRNRYGDCKDKAALLVALLRAIGEEGRVVLVSSGNPGAVRADWPSAAFNHAIVGLRADEATPASWPVVETGALGRLVLFDPTDPFTPLGWLPTGDQGGHGLIAAVEAATLIALPLADAATNRQDCRIDATIDDTGTLTATVDEVARGASGVAMQAAREQSGQERFRSALEARLQESVSHWRDLKWTAAWTPAEAEWRLRFEFKADRFARRTAGPLLLINPQVLPAKAGLPPWKTDGEGSVWVAGSSQRKEVRLTLPAGMTVVELPDDVSLTSPMATLCATYRRDGDAVVYRRDSTQRAGCLAKSGYDELRAFAQKVEEADRRPMVVRSGRESLPAGSR